MTPYRPLGYLVRPPHPGPWIPPRAPVPTWTRG